MLKNFNIKPLFFEVVPKPLLRRMRKREFQVLGGRKWISHR